MYSKDYIEISTYVLTQTIHIIMYYNIQSELDSLAIHRLYIKYGYFSFVYKTQTYTHNNGHARTYVHTSLFSHAIPRAFESVSLSVNTYRVNCMYLPTYQLLENRLTFYLNKLSNIFSHHFFLLSFASLLLVHIAQCIHCLTHIHTMNRDRRERVRGLARARSLTQFINILIGPIGAVMLRLLFMTLQI